MFERFLIIALAFMCFVLANEMDYQDWERSHDCAPALTKPNQTAVG
jgi:hypothetical protein